jgi:hypothetical protein
MPLPIDGGLEFPRMPLWQWIVIVLIVLIVIAMLVMHILGFAWLVQIKKVIVPKESFDNNTSAAFGSNLYFDSIRDDRFVDKPEIKRMAQLLNAQKGGAKLTSENLAFIKSVRQRYNLPENFGNENVTTAGTCPSKYIINGAELNTEAEAARALASYQESEMFKRKKKEGFTEEQLVRKMQGN